MEHQPKIIAIVGPTASGKTSLSIDLAKKFNGEIISADSRQIYRNLNIGTGKITPKEMSGVPHHLIDIADPMQIYTGSDFKQDATKAITKIIQTGHLPIIAGGTYFYLQLLRGTIQSAPVPPNEKFRATLADLSNAELVEKIKMADIDRATKLDPNNRRRLIRALEIINTLGKVPRPVKTRSPYEWLILGVDVNKTELRNNFAKRLEQWLTAGFQDETEQLLSQGITRERFKEFGFEYTLMLDFIDNKISLSELKEKFIQKNWQYAKRQMTWLKRDNKIKWYSPKNRTEVYAQVKNFLHHSNS